VLPGVDDGGEVHQVNGDYLEGDRVLQEETNVKEK